MERIYRQHFTGVVFNNVALSGLMDGNSVRVRPLGGKVEPTEGTDGPGVNISTRQGHIIEVDIREDSEDHEYIGDIARNQYDGGPGVPISLYMGTDRIFSAGAAWVGTPGDLDTGGPKMGGHTYIIYTKKPDLY